MSKRNAAAVALLGLVLGGCGQAEIVPMTPPGVPYRKLVTDTMEAEGERNSRGLIQPKRAAATSNPDVPPPGTARPQQPNAESTPPPK